MISSYIYRQLGGTCSLIIFVGFGNDWDSYRAEHIYSLVNKRNEQGNGGYLYQLFFKGC